MLLLALSLGTLTGTLLLVSLKQLPPALYVAILFSGSMILAARRLWRFKQDSNRNYHLFLTLFALSAILGFSWAYVQTYKQKWQLPDILFNQPVTLTGLIENSSVSNQSSSASLRCMIKLTNINGEQLEGTKAKVELFWQQPSVVVKPGQRIKATVLLKHHHGFSNPGGKDEEKYWFLQGVKAKGKILSVHKVTQPSYSLFSIRWSIVEKLKYLFPDDSYLPVITALTLGIRSDLDTETKQIFQKTGTSHLLAISGLHLGLVAGLCFFLVRRMVCIFPSILLRYPAPTIAAIFTLIVSLMYALLAGFGLPTQRAFIMICVFMSAIIFKRNLFSWYAFLLALWLVVLYDPLCVLQAGFWLSFLAVAALIMAQKQRHETTLKQKWCRWWQPQWRIFIALFPLTALFFHQISLVAPLANFIAIPIISAVVVPLSLLAIVVLYPFELLSQFLIKLALICFSLVWHLLNYLSDLPYSSVAVGTDSTFVIVLALIGCGIGLLPKGVPGKPLVLILCLPLFLNQPSSKKQQARISILDVGQGLCAVIETRHHVMLFDTGPKYSQFSDAGNRIIIPYLESRKIKSIDKVVLSHHDLDHRGGLHRLGSFNIKDIRSSEPNLLAQLGYATKSLTLCQAAQTWEWDGVKFEILHPLGEEKQRNDRSCVLKITAKQHSVLLPGDITQQVEKKLINAVKEKLKSDILIVPHHGSLTSSSSAFVEAVAPKYAVFATGFENQFGFPKQMVLDRYAKCSSENLLTYKTGAIIFELGEQEDLTPPIKWRETAKRIWHSDVDK